MLSGIAETPVFDLCKLLSLKTTCNIPMRAGWVNDPAHVSGLQWETGSSGPQKGKRAEYSGQAKFLQAPNYSVRIQIYP